MLKTGGFASPSHDGLALDSCTIYQPGDVLHNLSLPGDISSLAPSVMQYHFQSFALTTFDSLLSVPAALNAMSAK
jgi:hypothetical protein